MAIGLVARSTWVCRKRSEVPCSAALRHRDKLLPRLDGEDPEHVAGWRSQTSRYRRSWSTAPTCESSTACIDSELLSSEVSTRSRWSTSTADKLRVAHQQPASPGRP